MIHNGESPPKQFKPAAVTILETHNELWNKENLLASIRTSLPSNLTVQEVDLPWSSPSEKTFLFSITDMIVRAHATSNVVYVAVRTPSNTLRFGILHALSGENLDVQETILGNGTVLCCPTEAIVYHSDNMIKLPTSMTLAQATRKVTDMILNGIDTPCPICLKPPCPFSFFDPLVTILGRCNSIQLKFECLGVSNTKST
jgi:hypothetical protein